MFLREIRRRAGNQDEARFPFSAPAIRGFDALRVDAPVTFFVGENGSGKSTLLEAIALAGRLAGVGGAELREEASVESQRVRGQGLRVVWSRHTSRGFFLRAED